MKPVPDADEPDLRSLGRGSTLKIFGAGVNTALSLVLIVLVTRGYGQVKAGTFFAVTALFLLVAQIAEIGTEEAMLRLIPKMRTAGEAGRIPRLLRTAFLPLIAVSGAVGLLGFVTAPWVAGLISRSSDPQELTMLVRLLAVFVPALAITEVALAATRGYQAMRPSVFVWDVAIPVSQALLPLIGLIVVGPRLSYLVLAWVSPYLVAMVWSLLELRRLVRSDVREPDPGGQIEGFWRFTLPRGAARLFQHGLRRLDVVLVAALAGPREAAVYVAVSRFITVGSLGVQAVQQVVQPRLSELLQAGDRREASLGVFAASTLWLVAATWPIFILFAAHAQVLLGAFGQEYRTGAVALSLMCLAQLVTVATGPVDIALVMSGRSVASLVNQAASLGINVVGCFLFVPGAGVVGAAWAKVLALLNNNLTPAVQVRSRLGLHPFSRGFAIVAAAALLEFGLVSLFINRVLGPGPESLGASIVVGGGLYLLTLSRARIPELQSLMSSLRRIPKAVGA